MNEPRDGPASDRARTIAVSDVKRGDRVVVGVSGGPDSMALLHVLTQLSREYGWDFHLLVAHLNHGLRDGDSEGDAAFVQAAADSLDVPAAIEAKDVRALASEQGLGGLGAENLSGNEAEHRSALSRLLHRLADRLG